MPDRISSPLFTWVCEDLSDFAPESGAHYLLAESGEERSRHWAEWEHRAVDVQFVRIQEQDESEIRAQHADREYSALLRSGEQLARLLRSINAERLYVDITGLTHNAWAPIIRAARTLHIPTIVVYAEPGDYRYSPHPTETSIFDLSERIKGVGPLPGYATLSRHDDDDAIFVPLLGFEGARLAHLLEHIQPERDNVFPIIGVPGFRPVYPFFTYLGNRTPLLETRAWQNVRYARANCAYSVYYVLADIASKFPGRLIKVAPIGTKPHALGGVLYHLDNPTRVELVYDHPVRKAGRTEGVSRICLYDLTPLGPALSSRSSRDGPRRTA